MEIPLKPRDDVVRPALKEIKRIWDSVETNAVERGLHMALRLSNQPAALMRRGEIAHQLALRHERRGDTDKAQVFYLIALEEFGESEPLARARALRDFAMLTSIHVNAQQGLEMAMQALALHEQDRATYKSKDQRIKGERQQRITEGYVWRAQVRADVEAEHSLVQLTDFALYGSRDCCPRDQQILIDFLRNYADPAMNRALDLREIEISVKRGQIMHSALLGSKFILVTELRLARRALKTVTRRE